MMSLRHRYIPTHEATSPTALFTWTCPIPHPPVTPVEMAALSAGHLLVFTCLSAGSTATNFSRDESIALKLLCFLTLI